MIRRILHAEFSDVRALVYELRHRAVDAFHHNFFLDIRSDSGCLLLGSGVPGVVGAGYVLNDSNPSLWPDGARLLTIGRVTLAAWGGRPS